MPSKKELRQFGVIMGTVVALMLGLVVPWLWGVSFSLWPWTVAAILMVLGVVVPLALKPVYVVWMLIGHTINWLVSHLALMLVYYTVVFPMAVVMRVFKKDPMRRRLEHSATTYRVPAEQPDHKHLERPF